MPVDRSRYPVEWEEISYRIRQRANFKCEQCGVPNHAHITRSTIDPARYVIFDYKEGYFTTPDGTPARSDEIPDEYPIDEPEKETKVILTVHHIGVDHEDGTPGDMHDKMDCRDENLIALCQRCHLIADGPEHVKAMRETVYRRKQRELQADGWQCLPGFEVILGDNDHA